MQYSSWTNLLALIQSLAGVDSFTTTEQTKLLAMANRRLYQAYSASPVWPRYINGSQARPAPLGIMDYTYDDVGGIRTSTGTESRSVKTVTITCTAAVTFVSGMYVTVSGLGYSTTDPNGAYQVTGLSTVTITNDTFTYDLLSGTGTENYTGTATVTPTAIDDIEQVIRIWDGNAMQTPGGIEYEYYVQSDGYHIINNFNDLTGFWVAYRIQWPGPYTSSASTIPLEFFYWAAHATYADSLRMDGQVDKAMAEEGAAQTYLILEMDKAEHQRNNNAIMRRISTYVSRQAR